MKSKSIFSRSDSSHQEDSMPNSSSPGSMVSRGSVLEELYRQHRSRMRAPRAAPPPPPPPPRRNSQLTTTFRSLSCPLGPGCSPTSPKKDLENVDDESSTCTNNSRVAGMSNTNYV